MENPTTIWKFPMIVADVTRVSMPMGSRVLTVGLQGPRNDLVAWATVNPIAPTESREFLVRGTGHPLDGNEGRYIGTVFPGSLVFHIFEAKNDAGAGNDGPERNS